MSEDPMCEICNGSDMPLADIMGKLQCSNCFMRSMIGCTFDEAMAAETNARAEYSDSIAESDKACTHMINIVAQSILDSSDAPRVHAELINQLKKSTNEELMAMVSGFVMMAAMSRVSEIEGNDELPRGCESVL